MHIAPDRALTPLNLNGGFQIPYSSHSFKDDDIDDNSNGSKSSDKFKYATQLDNSLDLSRDELVFKERNVSGRVNLTDTQGKPYSFLCNTDASISQIPFKPKTKIIRELNVQGKGLLHLNLNNYRDLETLNCSYNCIADLEFLNDGYHLTQINMSHNQVRSLTTLENTPLRHLELSYNLIEGCIDFRELMHGSRDKLGWASLEYLCLTGNKIKELKNIHLLTNLRVLLVDNNNLEKVDNLHLLRYLETVSLMKNFNLPHLELKCLPLMQLKELHIDACKCLREWKICPPHIEVFEICNGAICDIPKWEYFPPNLKILKISNISGLRELPSNLYQIIPTVQRLDLTDNDLHDLKNILRAIPTTQLKYINLCRNPVTKQLSRRTAQNYEHVFRIACQIIENVHLVD